MLKFSGHDTIPVGVETASRETLDLLAGWADVVIAATPKAAQVYPDAWVWPMDDEPRAFNPILYRKVRGYIESYSDRLRGA